MVPETGASGLLESFLAEAQARGLSPRTRAEYARLIARFLTDFRALDVGSLHDFVFGPGPSGRPPAPATAAVRRAAMVAFFAFLVRRGHAARNVALELPAVRLRASLPRGLSPGEVQGLLAAIPDTAPGRRDRAIVLTALYTGLRRRELLGLSLDDLHFAEPPMVCVRVKGGAYRLRELPEPVLAAILSVHASRPTPPDNSDRRLFALSAAGFAANLRRYGRLAGLGNLTPHVLRHTAAKLRRTAGASLEEVSAFLGHASIATTAVYLRRLEGWRDDGWRDVSRLLALPHPQLLLDVEARAGPPHEWPSERGNAHSAGWQGGPERGTPLPTSHSTSRRGDRPHQLNGGAVVTAPWRDERIGLLKSALQKYIRRGETDKAIAVGGRLLQLPGGRSALARRLPVIAAEDVGITYLPAAATDHGEWDEASLLTVVARLSEAPKSKEAYWLAAMTWNDPRRVHDVTPVALSRDLTKGDHLGALHRVRAAKETRDWRSGQRLMSALHAHISGAPPHATAIAEAALRREAKGGFGTDELLAAAIIAAIDRPSDPPPSFLKAARPSNHPIELDFYVADAHTAVGQRALRQVALRRAMPVKLLADLMFSYESVLLGPMELPSRWKADAQELEARVCGWQSLETGRHLWHSLREEVAVAIRRELRKVTW